MKDRIVPAHDVFAPRCILCSKAPDEELLCTACPFTIHACDAHRRHGRYEIRAHFTYEHPEKLPSAILDMFIDQESAATNMRISYAKNPEKLYRFVQAVERRRASRTKE